ncbi:hypothetical protein [Roseibium sp.]|uniref:hypothetical protein n=1 Tax=Roseibium sp. TaxID=1936156 RepID=UPI00326408F3
MTRIGLVDGALPPAWPDLAGQDWFCEADGAPHSGDHAVAMTRTIRARANAVDVLNAVVFPGRLSTSLEAICNALAWLAEDPPDIVLCAFGMARSSADLAIAIARLQREGAIIVASAPAQGGSVYPAALYGVVSVQGDARCAPGELSRLDLPHATFGACPQAAGSCGIRGASTAAAHVAGLLAHRDPALSASASALLEPHIRYRGRERRNDQREFAGRSSE